MGFVPGASRRPDEPLSNRPTGESRAGVVKDGLRVVMVVANDVTRDSRVLREASALAHAGHHVTVLGIMTARTEAPAIEVREGFVIRRLPYRARPPGWWVPPDFYARVRYRSDRQYRIHRARVLALFHVAHREGRLANSRLHRFLDSFARPGATDHRLTTRLRRSRPSSAGGRVARLLTRVSRRVRQVRIRAYALRSRIRRAARTPLHAWPRKSLSLSKRLAQYTRSVVTGSVQAGPGTSAAVVRRTHDTLTAFIGGALHAAARARARVRAGMRSWLSATLGVGARATAIGIGVVGSVGRGIQAWLGILTLLVWGSGYLLANRASRGAVEWLTGWRWRWLGWAQYVAEHAPEADVWHGHDMTSLPAVVELKRRRGGIVVYDSHEVYFESGRHALQPRWARAPLERLERHLVAEADAVITVNQSLAEILGRRLGREGIEVLYNCPARLERTPRSSRLRRTLGLSRATPLLLYHGSLAPHRGVEQLLEAIQRPELSSAHLAFMGFGQLTDWLRKEAAQARYGRRVHVLDAVPPEELLSWIAGVDVAVAPIQPSTLNHRYSSPNKVFEAIASGTPVAGSDFAEFRRVIRDPRRGPLGTLFDPTRPEDIAAAIRRLLDLTPGERATLRERCRRASLERWSWEIESLRLVRLYGRFYEHRRARGNPRAVEVGAA